MPEGRWKEKASRSFYPAYEQGNVTKWNTSALAEVYHVAPKKDGSSVEEVGYSRNNQLLHATCIYRFAVDVDFVAVGWAGWSVIT